MQNLSIMIILKKILRKILDLPLWLIAIIVCFITYWCDRWYVDTMFARWAESDGTDSEAYAVFNHHSSDDFIFISAIIVLAFWLIRKILRKKL